MSFRYLCLFFNLVFDFFDFLSGIAIDGDCFSANRFHMYCRFCCLFSFCSAFVIAWAVARSLSPVLARVVAFSLYYSFAPYMLTVALH